MSNSLDREQALQIVGPDLGPNCLQRLSADDTSFVWFFTSQYTAMVMLGRSVHQTTFSWVSLTKRLTSTSCTYFRL